MKRITYWPQAWLGIAMNFGLVISWVAVTEKVDVRLLALLMVGSWGWTMHYGLSPFPHYRTKLTSKQIQSTLARIARMTSKLASSQRLSCSVTSFAHSRSAVPSSSSPHSPTPVYSTRRPRTSSMLPLVVPRFTLFGNTSQSTSTPPIAVAVSSPLLHHGYN